MKKYTTINDVADSLGVSTTTVWRAINNTGRISKKTKDKILSKVEELGYRPSKIATSLKTNKSNLIGFIAPYITDVNNEVLNILNNKALEKGYNIITGISDNIIAKELELAYQMYERRIEGLILFGATDYTGFLKEDMCNHLLDLQNSGVKVVGLNYLNSSEIPFFCTDEYLSTKMLVKYFAEMGLKRVGFLHLNFVNDNHDEYSRYNGYIDGVKEYNLDFDENFAGHVLVDDDNPVVFSHKKLYDYYINYKPEAIICVCDSQAINYMNALRCYGVNCPEDVKIVGIDDAYRDTISWPQLTCVDMRLQERASIAFDTLFDAIVNGTKIEPKQYVFEPELIIRDSCGYNDFISVRKNYNVNNKFY